MGREDVTREMCNTWKSDRLIASIILSEHLGQLVGNVMGWPSVRIAQDDLIWKPPCQPKTVVGFHQDSAYISSQFEPYENNSVTVWIALDDADVETGCVEYVAGSHQWRPLKHLERQSSVTNEGVIMKESAVFHTCDAETYRHSLPNNEGANAEPVPVKEGYAIFHHQDVWHGSGPNQSATKHRRALVGHYIRGDIEFRGNGGENFYQRPHFECRFDSLYLLSLTDSTSCTPWGNTSYIYGRYKRYKSTQVDESFFPITFAVDGCGQARTPWIDHFLKKH